MVTILALLGVVLVLFLAAVLATREGPVMADAPQDAADLALPDGPLQPEDVRALRFGMAPRGYRMSEVDRVLDRLVSELAERDRRLAELGATPVPATAPAAPAAPVVPAAPAAPIGAAPVTSTPVTPASTPPAGTAAPTPPAAEPRPDAAPAQAGSAPVGSGGDLPPGARH